MSYILDALRRADAERTRGVVPGLHAQNIPGDDEPAARNFKPLIWAAGGAGTLLAVVVAVLAFGPWRNAPSGPVALAPAPQLNAGPTPADTPATTAPGETPAARPGAIEPAALPVEPPITRANPAADANVRAAPAPAAPIPATASPRLAERAAEGRVATLEPRGTANAQAGRVPDAVAPVAPVEHYGAPTAPAPAPTPAPVATTAAPSAHAPALPNINDLPPATRAELPRLAFGGSIYSPSPTDRMVLLNGQVFHEGDKPAPDTVLEQIRFKSVVLNYRGQRYEVSN